MSRRGQQRFHGNRRENPQGGWWDSGKDYSTLNVVDDYGRHVAQIKSTIHKYFGTCTYESKVNEDGVQIKFRIPTMRAWMDGMIAMKKADKKRQQKWVPKIAASIGETISKILFSRHKDAEIEVYAMIDDTLPPEGMMTEQELEIIYGT